MSQNLTKYDSLFGRDDLFNDLFRGRFPSIFNEKQNLIQFPKINISDNEKNIIVTASVPGIAGKDISINVEDNLLTISGHTKREEEEGKEDSDYYRFEREEGSFTRTVSLPNQVDESKVEAKTKNGVLTITLPKIEKTNNHKIHIKEE